MKQITFLKLMMLGGFALALTSCNKSNVEGRLIPKEAGFVLKIDGKALSAKLPWSEIKQNPVFQHMYGDSNLPASIKSFLDNPASAGVDPASDFILFSVQDSLGGYVGVEGKVQDVNTFKNFNSQAVKTGIASEQDGVQYLTGNPVCIGWTKEKFVYVLDVPQMAHMDELSERMMRDSITPDVKSTRDVTATCKSIFLLDESNTLAENEKFTSLMKDKGDIQFFINVEELNKSTGTKGPLAMLNLDKFYKGNVTTGILNFENGKMQVDMKSYASDELINIFRKYGGGRITDDMIKRIPGKDVVAFLALHFKPEGIRELIKLSGMDGLVNMGVSKLGFTMDDFIKANQGDIVVGVSDLSIKADSLRTNKQNDSIVGFNRKPSFNFIFAAAIGDKDAFNKLVNAGKNLLKEKIPDSVNAPFAYNMNGTYFVLGNSKENVDKYLGTEKKDFEFINKISGEPFAGYLNLQAMMRSVGVGNFKDSSAKLAYDMSLQMWDNVFWKGGNYKDGAILQSMEINLVDKETNSLKQLNQYAAKLAPSLKEKNRRKKDLSNSGDQALTPEPMKDSASRQSAN